MTQKEKQIKLLEASGWKKEYIDGNGIDDEVWIHPTTKKCWLADIAPLPDYFNDLNACAKLKELLTNKPYSYKFGISTYSSNQQQDYLSLLLHGSPPSFMEDGCGKRGVDMPMPPGKMTHLAGGIDATAAQRAEAIGLILKLW